MSDTYTIFYDGRCMLCTETRNRLEQVETSAVLRFVDINRRGALEGYPIDPSAARGQMHVVDPSGSITAGFDSLLTIAQTIPSIRAIVPVLRFSPVRALGHTFYRWMARHRFRIFGTIPCHDGACRI